MKTLNSKNKFLITKDYSSLFICFIFSLCGGFMDTFSYIKLGNIFANAQTGNLIFMGINLYQGFFIEALHYFLPIVAFALGVFMSTIIEHLSTLIDMKSLLKTLPILLEIGVFLVIPALSIKYSYLANMLISFVCGLQLETFKNFNSKTVNTTMCVGNLRIVSKNLSLYLFKKDLLYLKNFILYVLVIFAFISGAILGNFFIYKFDLNAIYICCLLLLIPLFYYWKENKTN